MKERNKQLLVIVVMALLLTIGSVWCWMKPADSYSASERRSLASFPKLTAQTVKSGRFMSDFESYTQDQFPLRDTMRRIKAMAAYYLFGQKDNNGIYLENGYVSKLQGQNNPYMLQTAANKFRALYEMYLQGMDVYLAVVPDKDQFLGKELGYPVLDYEEMTAYLQKELDFMTYIPVNDLLTLDNFYRTDTHWRQESIVPVAERLGEAMGADVKTEYVEKTVDAPFYGVYYGQSAMPLKPDTLHYLTNEVLENAIVTSFDTGKPQSAPLYDMDKAVGKDGYEMFLGGANALLTVENPMADTDKELIIFRDSFGSSLTPLLVSGYRKITVVDIRYVQSAMLGRLMDFSNQDVLFVYSTLLINSSTAFK